jgi:hypothetical protein
MLFAQCGLDTFEFCCNGHTHSRVVLATHRRRETRAQAVIAGIEQIWILILSNQGQHFWAVSVGLYELLPHGPLNYSDKQSRPGVRTWSACKVAG